MSQKNIDLIILTSKPNTRYLLDIYEPACAVCITKKDSFILSSPTDVVKVENLRKKMKTYTFSSNDKADIKAGKITDAIKKLKINTKTIGAELSFLPYTSYEKMKEISKYKIIDISQDMFLLRSIKTPEEIRRMKKAAKLTSKAMKTARENLRVGITERELASIVEESFRKNCDWFSFETLVASGRNTALIHAMPTDKKIKNTDLVLIDCGMVYKNYCSDMTRTFCLKPGKREKLIYDTVLNAQKIGLRKLKPGIKSSVIFNQVRNFLKIKKFDLVHGLGHGVGTQVHEEPSLSLDSETKLRPNMIFTIEPGVYIKNYGGVRIEDMVLLKKNNIEILTNFPRRL